jgi:hypothetical protein
MTQLREDAGAAQNAFEAENRLFRNRIRQVLDEAHRLERTGNAEDMASARRKYEEAERLTREQFQLQTNYQRQQLQLGLQIRAIETGMPQRGTVQINVNELERNLAGIRSQATRGEQNFQVAQHQTIANGQVMLNLERQRQRGIVDSMHALEGFSLTEQREGREQLRPEYAIPGGLQAARERLRQLSQTALQSLGPVQLNEQDISNLRRRLTAEQIAEMQESLRRGQLTAQQRVALEQSVTAERLQQIQTQLQNFTINAQAELELRRTIRRMEAELDETFRRQRMADELRANEQILRANAAAAQRARQEAERQRTEATTASQGQTAQAVQQLGQLETDINRRLAGLSLVQSTAGRMQFEPMIAEARNALGDLQRVRASNNSSVEDIQRASDRATRALTALIQVQQQFFAGVGSQPINTAALEGTTERIRTTTTALVNANNALAATMQRITDLDNQIARLPTNLATAAAAAVAATEAQNQALNNTSVQINNVARALERLQAAFAGMGMLRPSANPNFVGPPAPVPGQAQGGLLGNTFASRGPDDMLIAARRGEFVINPESTRRFYPQLVAINSGNLPGFAQGGLVSSTTNVGDITIKVDGAGSPEETARTVLAKIRREIRRGN